MAVQAGSLEVALHPSDEVSLVEVAGELDLATAPELEAALRDALSEHPARVVVDLAAVAFADSTCVHLLVRARNEAAERGIGFRVVAPEGSAGAVFALCGADHLLEPVPPAPQPRFLNEWSR
jgi:anti-sigma B factor antagonist